jgi:hypothetical protein
MPLRWEILGIPLQDEPIVAVGTGLLAELYQVVDGCPGEIKEPLQAEVVLVRVPIQPPRLYYRNGPEWRGDAWERRQRCR